MFSRLKMLPKFLKFRQPPSFLHLKMNCFSQKNILNVENKPIGTGIPTNMGFDHCGFVVPNAQQAADFLIDVFDAEFDWEVKREKHPTFGERGWDKTFGTHPDCYMPHVIMLKCGDLPLTQYVEIFEFVSPDQEKLQGEGGWHRFSDVGNSYISFTVKDIEKVIDHIRTVVMPKWKGVRFIQDPPMTFPLRGEVCTSFFITTPWGMWIEITNWSKSKEKGKIIKRQQIKETNKYVGQHISNIPTPSFLIDLDAVDHNVDLLSTRSKEKGIRWRVVGKAHKCPDFTRYILNRAGLDGIVLLTLTEAETFAEEGFQDIFLTNEVGTSDELKRISTLAKKIKKIVVNVDSLEYLNALSDQVRKWEITTPVHVMVELNIGHNRCGVELNNVLPLVKRVKELEQNYKSVIFEGLSGYEGHTPILEPSEKTKQTRISHEVLKQARHIVESNGINVGVVSAGGSCNYIDSLNMGVISELQAGGGALCDWLYYHKANLKDHGHKMGSLILSTIISAPEDGSRAMGNAGFKALGWHPFGGLPVIRDRKDIKCIGLSAEHTKFQGVDPNNPEKSSPLNLKRGDKLVMYPGYTDAMGFLHREIYAIRNDHVVDVWKTLSSETWK